MDGSIRGVYDRNFIICYTNASSTDFLLTSGVITLGCACYEKPHPALCVCGGRAELIEGRIQAFASSY